MSQQANSDEKKPLDIKLVSRILKTPSESRTMKQCTELLEIIGDLQFFKEYIANPSSANVPKLCCKYMEIEKFENNDIIFELGSIGNKFYIILQGQVGIFIQKPPAMLEKQQEEKKKETDQVVDKLADFMNVKELGDGSAFGELALLNNKPRLATIKCLKETYVATLSKENFNKILKEHEEQKLNKEIQFFEKVHAFKDFNQKQIRYLCLNNKTIETTKGDVIFDEKDPCDCLYVIKEGEFEIYKSVEKLIDLKEEIMKQSILSMSVLNKNHAQKVTKQIKIKVLSVGETVGEEFFLKKKQREFKLVCSSFNGIIVKIKSCDFLRKISEDPAVHKAFFNRFKQIHEENEERVQKRILQFHEFKNFLVEDRIPTKIKMSIEKLYSNSSMTPKQREDGISEFRQQLIEIDNLQKKNEHQQAILSKSALSHRFNQANSMMFQNQVQYLKYKRLNIIAEQQQSQSQQTPKGIESPRSTTLSNRLQMGQIDNRRVSFSTAASNALQSSSANGNSSIHNPNYHHHYSSQQYPQVQENNKFKTHGSLNDINQSDLNLVEISEEQQFDDYKTQINKITTDRVNKTSIRRQYQSNNQLSTDNLHPIKNNQNSSYFSHASAQQKNNLNQVNQLNQNNLNTPNSNTNNLNTPNTNIKALSEEKQLKEGTSSSSSPQQFQQQQISNIMLNNSNTLSKNISHVNDQSFNDQDASPNPNNNNPSLSKNRSALFGNQISGQKYKSDAVIQNYHLDSDQSPQKMDTHLYQFNVSQKRLIKYTNNISKDNFIRDWKKNSNLVYEDAQQENLARKIKKITSSNNKFSDYFKSQQIGQNSIEKLSGGQQHVSPPGIHSSPSPLPLQGQQSSPPGQQNASPQGQQYPSSQAQQRASFSFSSNIYPLHMSQKFDNQNSNGSAQPLVLPRIYDSNLNNFNNGLNGNISSFNGESDILKKVQTLQAAKPLNLKLIFQNKDMKDKKRLLIVS